MLRPAPFKSSGGVSSMKRVVDILIAAAILAIPALTIAQAPAASVAAATTSHHYVASSLIRPDSAASPGDPGIM